MLTEGGVGSKKTRLPFLRAIKAGTATVREEEREKEEPTRKDVMKDEPFFEGRRGITKGRSCDQGAKILI